MDSPCSCGHFEMRLTSVDLFGAFGQERIDTLMFLTKASEDEIRGVGGGLDPGTVRAPWRDKPDMAWWLLISSRGDFAKSTERSRKKRDDFLFCQKANCIIKSTFSAFFCLFPPFRLFHRIRLLDFPALVPTVLQQEGKVCPCSGSAGTWLSIWGRDFRDI